MELPRKIGRYELLEQIGAGRMGVLYRGEDTVLGRPVAVKVMAAGFLGDDAAKTRFFRAAKAAVRLQHVNIVTIYEFGDHEGTPYIVMELLRGRSLAERLRQGAPLPLLEALDTAIQLCNGLEAAHADGVVHRDVRPPNVWICHDRTIKLLDFGLATAASSGATFSDAMGKPGYLSPEQVTGIAVDSRTDIYSAGVVLYEMLTGSVPFDANSPTDVMLKILNEAAQPLSVRQVDPTLSAVVARAMEKSPAARYPRAADFGGELKAFRADLPLPAEPATVVYDLAEPTVVHTAQTQPIAVPFAVRVQALVSRFAQVPVRRLGAPAAGAALVAAVVAAWWLWPSSKVAPTGASTDTASTNAASPTPRPSPPVLPPEPPVVEPPVADPPVADPPVADPPRPAAPTLTLSIRSRPASAMVIIDGKAVGVTPQQLSVNPARPPKRIELELTGYRTERVPVTSNTLQSGSIDVLLTPRETAPPPVTVVVSGEYPFEIVDRQRVLSPASQRHDVVVSGVRSIQLRSARYFLEQTVPIDRNQGGTVTATVPPLGSVTVYATGPLEDCKVFIDDRIVDAGSMPVVNRAIASGRHRVKLGCRRGDTDPHQITVFPHQDASTRFPATTPVRPR